MHSKGEVDTMSEPIIMHAKHKNEIRIRFMFPYMYTDPDVLTIMAFASVCVSSLLQQLLVRTERPPNIYSALFENHISFGSAVWFFLSLFNGLAIKCNRFPWARQFSSLPMHYLWPLRQSKMHGQINAHRIFIGIARFQRRLRRALFHLPVV